MVEALQQSFLATEHDVGDDGRHYWGLCSGRSWSRLLSGLAFGDGAHRQHRAGTAAWRQATGLRRLPAARTDTQLDLGPQRAPRSIAL